MRRKYLIVIVSVLSVIVLDVALQYAVGFDYGLQDMLYVKPRPDRVYALGNSMFKTGIDFELLNQLLPPNEHADFEYHNGYYSNLWYLILRRAIIPAREHPKVIVWGFRPTYAILPAFRKARVGDIEKFYQSEDMNDMNYEKKVQQQKISWKDAFKIDLESRSFIYGKRNSIKNIISDIVNRISIFSLKPFVSADRHRELKRNFVAKNQSVLDLIIKELTHGRRVMMEETVADQGSKFVKGKRASFDDSFIPDIASMISEAGIPQFVIIFKPVAHVEGKLDAETLRFAEDAESFFKAKSIPYINFMKDDRIVREYYAKVDHYNAEGRLLITKSLGERLSQLLAGINQEEYVKK